MIRIERLNPSLAQELEEHASLAFVGENKTCSLDNKERSCFAAELCRAKGSQSCGDMSLKSFLSSDAAFVAMTDVDTDGHTKLARKRFVGSISCVSLQVEDCDSMQLQYPCCMVSNVCVSDPYRKSGTGTVLLKLMLAWIYSNRPGNVSLKVVKEPIHGCSVLQHRREKLFQFYGKFGFGLVSTHGDFYLFQRLCKNNKFNIGNTLEFSDS